MIVYDVKLTPDDNGTLLVTVSDLPEVTTFGDTEADALANAQNAVLEAIAARMHEREDVPLPGLARGRKTGRKQVVLPLQAELKLRLYLTMRSAEIRNSELARRMRLPRQEIDRILDLDHGTALGKLEHAFAVLGRNVVVAVEPIEA